MIVIDCLLVIAGLYIVFILAPSFVMFKTVFCRKKAIPYTERDLKDTYLWQYAEKISADFRFFDEIPAEKVTVTAYDGTELVGYRYSCGSGKLAICMHGYCSTPLNCFASVGRFLLSNGYDVLLVHQRGHGESGGAYTAMGLLEQYDAVTWCEWADGREDVREIVLFGVSMGCASVAYASDKIKSPKVRAMILDCGFVSPYQQLEHDCRKRHLPYGLLLPLVRLFTRLFMKIDIRKPVWQSLEHTGIPALFIHGRKDTTVLLSETEENHKHCASEKELYIAENAFHATAFLAGGEEAEKAIGSFLGFAL